MALSGCGYLRLHAVNDMAKHAHLALDGQGTSPGLDLSGLPADHTVGIDWSELLSQGLGMDVENPAVIKMTDTQLRELQHLSFEEYQLKQMDPTVCGEWQYIYFGNDASLVPVPHAKFNTWQLAELLTPDLMMGSLHKGVCGRALVEAANEVGIALCAPQHFHPLPAQLHQQLYLSAASFRPRQFLRHFPLSVLESGLKQLAGTGAAEEAGPGSVGSASVWVFLQAQLAGSRVNLANLAFKGKALAIAMVGAVATILHHQQQQ